MGRRSPMTITSSPPTPSRTGRGRPRPRRPGRLAHQPGGADPRRTPAARRRRRRRGRPAGPRAAAGGDSHPCLRPRRPLRPSSPRRPRGTAGGVRSRARRWLLRDAPCPRGPRAPRARHVRLFFLYYRHRGPDPRVRRSCSARVVPATRSPTPSSRSRPTSTRSVADGSPRPGHARPARCRALRCHQVPGAPAESGLRPAQHPAEGRRVRRAARPHGHPLRER